MGIVELAYDDLGAGTPWVFLHGFPLTRMLWEPQHVLAGEARLVLPDLRGHGGSPPNTHATMDAMARDVLALCDTLGIERFGLVGLSMGGYVAFELHRLAPERVTRMVLAATQAEPDTPEAAEGRERLAHQVDKDGIEPLLDAFLPKLLSPRALADEAIVSKVRAMVLSNDPEAMAATLRGMARRVDQRPRLGDITCPVLIVHGEVDGAIPLAHAQALERTLPRARLAEVEEAGHLVNLEVPEAFNATLRGFMEEALVEDALQASP
jgi:3-oxoadipate enol-lactonase